jgi:hypothetical protein
MKTIFFSLFICVFIVSCEVNENIPNETNVVPKFILSDLNGNEKNVFKYGNEIKMLFSITNTSDKQLTFQFTGAAVQFKILMSDTVFATSSDNIVYAQVVTSIKVVPGESFQEEWIGPNTLGRNPKIVLPVGKYKAIVQHNGLFDNYKINETEPIEFSVIN